LTVHDICSSSTVKTKQKINKKKNYERERFAKILKEKFDITYTDEIRKSIVEAIQIGTGRFIAKESRKVSIWENVIPGYSSIRVTYHKKKHEPIDAVDTKYEERKHFGKRLEERAGITYTEEIRQSIVDSIQTGKGEFVGRREGDVSVWRNVVPDRPDLQVVYDRITHEPATVLFGHWPAVKKIKRKSKSKK
jgi:hypothetical protein